MTDDVRVSVVMIFLDAERFLQEAIESVLAQTYQSWELLLVDDGSRDQSTRLAKSYAHQYPGRIIYLEHPGHQHRGMSATRNLGIRSARGLYITFLDADDVILPTKLEQQVGILEKCNEAAMVCGRALWWYSWDTYSPDSTRDFVQRLDVPLNSVVEPPRVLALFLKDEWASLCDVMVRRDVVHAVGGYEETFQGMYEDQVFHAKICLTYPVFVSSECWYRYRQHADSCTAKSHARAESTAARFVFLNWLQRYVALHKMSATEVGVFLKRELFPYRHPFLFRIARRIRAGSVWNLPARVGRAILPASLYGWLRKNLKHQLWPPVGWVRFGSLRRVTPIGKAWPNHRGTPVDRYYIEGFLQRNARDVRGSVLELGDATYTHRFGATRVTRSEVLHGREGNPAATLVADLAHAETIASDSFDCIILTQTLLLIYDVHAAIQTLHRILKPGGVALVTVPGITHIMRDEMNTYGQYWSFTTLSARRLFEEAFMSSNVSVEAFGNVLVATGFLFGLAVEDFRPSELQHHDPDYELIIGVRAVKAPRDSQT